MLTKIKELLLKAVQYFKGAEASTESEKMDKGMTLWEKMYEDNSPWVDDKTIFSLGLPKTICEKVASLVLNEAVIRVEGKSKRAEYLNDMIQRHLLPNLAESLEKGMAVGGFIMRPYADDYTKQIYIDICRQGEFRALGFDKDRHLTDVEFYDYYVEGKKTISRVERQKVNRDSIECENKCFVSTGSGLGNEIAIEQTDWESIAPQITFNQTDKRELPSALYGYYRVAKANNKDTSSALGISIFGTSTRLIERADRQFSRLDWEYDGGQMAVDVSEDAITPETYDAYNPSPVDETRKRIYRKIDLNSDATYEVFAPSLRDGSYLQGLDRYLMLIEDKVGLARGSLGYVASEARTATEIKTLKQNTYDTVHNNQHNLEMAIRDLVEAMDFLATTYKLVEEGDYSLVISWNDSVLEDYQTELNRELQLMDAGVKSKVEVRMFATGEDEKTAQEKIDLIGASEDLFAGLEGNE